MRECVNRGARRGVSACACACVRVCLCVRACERAWASDPSTYSPGKPAIGTRARSKGTYRRFGVSCERGQQHTSILLLDSLVPYPRERASEDRRRKDAEIARAERDSGLDCVCACVRACVRECVRACVFVVTSHNGLLGFFQSGELTRTE